MKDVQCYELFGGIALKDHAFSLSDLMSNWLTKRLVFLSHLLRFDLSMIYHCIVSKCLRKLWRHYGRFVSILFF